jgi:hypothetical protein
VPLWPGFIPQDESNLWRGLFNFKETLYPWKSRKGGLLFVRFPYFLLDIASNIKYGQKIKFKSKRFTTDSQ